MDMPVRRLGRSGLRVSRIVLGCMNFGSRTEQPEALRIIRTAEEAGVNFIDTADTYSGGRSEEITGAAIADRRHHWVLATKLANPNGTGPNERGLSRKWILQEAHASLKRLNTDFVDILYLHKDDPETPQHETVRALAQLQHEGSIRYFGVSNFSAWRIAQLCAICDEEGIDRPVVAQPLYHALNRAIEVEILPACEALGIGTAVYSPTARGVLSGKYVQDAPPPSDSRAAIAEKRILQTVFQPETLAAAARIAAYAQERGAQPTAFAIAWVLANANVTAAIAGPRTMEQWLSYIEALKIVWTQADEDFIDGIVARGCNVVPQYVDPQYPVTGRAEIVRTR